MSYEIALTVNRGVNDSLRQHRARFPDHNETRLEDDEIGVLAYIQCSCGSSWSWHLISDEEMS